MGCTTSIHAGTAALTWLAKSSPEPVLHEALPDTGRTAGAESKIRWPRWFGMLQSSQAGETPGGEARLSCFRNSWDVSAKQGDAKEADGRAEWRARAVELAVAALPFVPARVSVAFAQGVLEGSPPAPRRVKAALLMVDISGFTALSEDARRRLGSEGVERFSLALSSFFAAMLEEIAGYRGDVDCFAGDAVLVAFYPERGDAGENADYTDYVPSEWALPGSRQEPGSAELHEALQAAVRRALECAMAVHARMDGFRHEPDDPPLRVHSALAAGKN